jgi:hypothetical protein
MIIAQFIKFGLCLRNLIGDFGDHYAGCSKQFRRSISAVAYAAPYGLIWGTK